MDRIYYRIHTSNNVASESMTTNIVQKKITSVYLPRIKLNCSLQIQFLYGKYARCSPISSKSIYENTGLWRDETVNPASWNSLMNSGKNLKLAAVPRNKPKACSSGAMIYHQPYQLLLSSSCQLGQPNGWLKCMCGHPRVKWRLWLRQKMDSCGSACSLIQRNVIDMFLCLLFLLLLLSTFLLLCQTQPFDKCPA